MSSTIVLCSSLPLIICRCFTFFSFVSQLKALLEGTAQNSLDSL